MTGHDEIVSTGVIVCDGCGERVERRSRSRYEVRQELTEQGWTQTYGSFSRTYDWCPKHSRGVRSAGTR